MMQVSVILGFAFGLLLLRGVWRIETAWIGTTIPLYLPFLAAQQLVFGLGPLILIFLSGDTIFTNLRGTFPLTFGIDRAVFLNSLSLLASVFGLLIPAFGALSPLKRRGRGAAGKAIRSIPTRRLDLMVFSLLGLQYATIILAWVTGLNPSLIGNWFNYVANFMGRATPGVFLLAGVTWPQLHPASRLAVAASVLFMGIWYLPTGGRTGALLPLFLLFLGLMVSRNASHRVRLKVIFAFSIIATVAVLMSSAVETARTYEFERGASSPREMLSRLQLVLETIPKTDTRESLLRFGIRLSGLPAVSVIGFTPDEIPFVGWEEAMWSNLLADFLPVRIFPDLPVDRTIDGPLVLTTYGWVVDPYSERSHAEDVTVLADAWRRFGYYGVVGFYVVLGVVLGAIDLFLARRSMNSFWIATAALLAASLSLTYVQSMAQFVTLLPKNAIVSLNVALLATISIGVFAPIRNSAREKQDKTVERVD